MDRLRAMEIACAIADTEGLASAARVLSLSPPTVTRVLGELERHLGAKLFHRTTRVVSLTEVGAAYVQNARRIVREAQEADDLARGAQIRPTGTLRVTASVLFGQKYIAPILRELVERYEGVQVEAFFVDRVVNLIDEGFDVAVRIGQLPDSSLRATRVGAVRRVVCGAPDYLAQAGRPVRPEDLTSHRIVHFTGDGPECRWSFDDGSTVALRPRLTFSTLAACIDSARSGFGLTRALSYQVADACDDGELEPVLENALQERWPIHLMHAEGSLKSAKVRTFLDLAAERLRADERLR